YIAPNRSRLNHRLAVVYNSARLDRARCLLGLLACADEIGNHLRGDLLAAISLRLQLANKPGGELLGVDLADDGGLPTASDIDLHLRAAAQVRIDQLGEVHALLEELAHHLRNFLVGVTDDALGLHAALQPPGVCGGEDAQALDDLIRVASLEVIG